MGVLNSSCTWRLLTSSLHEVDVTYGRLVAQCVCTVKYLVNSRFLLQRRGRRKGGVLLVLDNKQRVEISVHSAFSPPPSSLSLSLSLSVSRFFLGSGRRARGGGGGGGGGHLKGSLPYAHF